MATPVQRFVLIAFACAALGYVMLGIAGAMLALAAALAARRLLARRAGASPQRAEEEARLAAFMADALAVPSAGTPAEGTAPKPAPKPDFEALRARIDALPAQACFETLAAARLASLENPRDAHLAAEAALAARRVATDAARSRVRLGAAGRAIGIALANGRGGLAVALFRTFIDDRVRLPLDAAQLEALGRVLLAKGAFLEAAWALHAGALRGGDAQGAQRRLIEVAERAAQAGAPQAARHLYATLLEKHPGSAYAGFAQAQLRALGKRSATR